MEGLIVGAEGNPRGFGIEKNRSDWPESAGKKLSETQGILVILGEF